MRTLALTFLLHSVSGLIREEITGPIREVSPEEFHQLALRQIHQGKPDPAKLIAKGGGKKGQGKNAKKAVEAAPKKPNPNKGLTPAERQAKKELWLANKGLRQAENAQNRNKHQEELIMEQIAEEKKAALEAQKAAQAEGEEQAEQERGTAPKAPLLKNKAKEEPLAENLAKANKTYACAEKGKEVLVFYNSGLNIAPTTVNKFREKCMRAQLNQHCMPYEKFDATYIEPCDSTDYECFQRRIIQDHPTCLNRNVDWEAIKNYGEGAKQTITEVLAGWCSQIKMLKEVQRRVALDEKFLEEYGGVLLLQDHAFLDKEWTEEVTRDWVYNYRGKWDIVQFDPRDGRADTDKIAEFRGKKIWRPSWKSTYGGFQAVLIKTSSINPILEKMQMMNVLPIEMVLKSMNDDPKGLEILSWESGVSTVPWKASKETKDFFLPKDCMNEPTDNKLKENRK